MVAIGHVAEGGVTTGVTGAAWRATVTSSGSVVPHDGTPALDWYVAADDRWHDPAIEASVRHRRIDAAAATETRVRVPGGDVVQRVYSVADGGGITVVEVENETTLPVAIAFSHRTVLTERPIADVAIEGIELGPDAFVLPLGHQATLRVGVSHRTGLAGPLPSIASCAQVVRGWTQTVERASRFVLPDGDRGAGAALRLAAMRCELALGEIPDGADDPVGFALALGELVRMGERPDAWLPELVTAVEAVGRESTWEAGAALDAAGRVLAVAKEHRALRDLARIAARHERARRPQRPPDGLAFVAWFEQGFASGGVVMPDGVPRAWWGQSIECHGVPTSARSTLSFALRWHGERPAILWEQAGDPVGLTAPVAAPAWSTTSPRGESLWPAP